jgi:hypothetical protein
MSYARRFEYKPQQFLGKDEDSLEENVVLQNKVTCQLCFSNIISYAIGIFL